jgi:hypothetical protein
MCDLPRSQAASHTLALPSCQTAARAQDDSAAKARAAVKAFCASPAFKKLSCAYNGVMGADEDAATTADISPFSGTMWAILPKPSELPKAINARDRWVLWGAGGWGHA